MLKWKQVEGAKHDTFWLGSVKIPIPRHAEIGQRTTEDILHECEAELGKGLVAALSTYHAELHRDGKVWRIRVPEVARTTQAAHAARGRADGPRPHRHHGQHPGRLVRP